MIANKSGFTEKSEFKIGDKSKWLASFGVLEYKLADGTIWRIGFSIAYTFIS